MTPEPRLHVAIIPDGNRRWARAQGLMAWRGHERSAENFRALLDWVRDDGRIGTVTFWCFSTENWKRDPKEVEKLMSILERYLRDERETMKKEGVRLVHSGRKDRLSPGLAALLEDVCADTAAGETYTLNLAIDYGGKDELLRAVGKLQGADPTDDAIRSRLDHPELPDIDLIIRTSGEQRTSNFALWQSTYAEWMFSGKYFPDFTGGDLGDAVDSFLKRQRRFGA
jgi:undecaprenyl diphosphate synthase